MRKIKLIICLVLVFVCCAVVCSACSFSLGNPNNPNHQENQENTDNGENNVAGIFTFANTDGQSITITGLTDYGKTNCSEIVIPREINGLPVTSIGKRAFMSCTGMTSIEIPNTVTKIEDEAFAGCTGLTNILIPDSVTDVGEWVFTACTELVEIFCEAESQPSGWNQAWQANCYATVVWDFYVAVILKYDTYSSGDGEFVEITGLTYYGKEYSTDIAIPSQITGLPVTSIAESAFRDCTGLTSITIPASVTSIGSGAFNGCTGLTTMNYLGTLDKWVQISFGGRGANPTSWTEKLVINGEAVVNAVISDGVTSIGSYAFYNCTGLSSIEIPNSVTNLGDNAFYNCTGLTSLEIPASVTSIGSCAFGGFKGKIYCEAASQPAGWSDSWEEDGYGSDFATVLWDCCVEDIFIYTKCAGADGEFVKIKGLTGVTEENYHEYMNIVIPSQINGLAVTSLGDNAFENCSWLSSVVIPNGVTSLGDYAFAGCKLLSKINIPNSVISIGDYAFSECTGLTSVFIPYGVNSIGTYAFFRCSGLTEISIPDSVTSVGAWALGSCANLTTLTIPKSVTAVGVGAFAAYLIIAEGDRVFKETKLTTIYCEAEAKPDGWDDGWYYSWNKRYDNDAEIIWGYQG